MYICYFTFRCATGEAWPNIMLACGAGQICDPGAVKKNSTTGSEMSDFLQWLEKNKGSIKEWEGHG